MRGRLLYVVTLCVGCCLGGSRALAADGIAACTAAYDDVQTLQKRGQYIEATRRSLDCMKDTCGAIVSGECAKLYEAIESATPSVVLGARDADQNDLLDVRVSVDGKVVGDKLDGTPLTVDPGPHVFRFEAPGLPVVERSVTVRAGEKLRLISETLGEPRKVDPRLIRGGPSNPDLLVPRLSTGGHEPLLSTRTARTGALVLGGIGVVAFGSFGGLRASAMNDYRALSTTCSPDCKADDIDAVRRKFVFSSVSLGAGLLAAGGAAVLLLLSPGKSSSTQIQIAPQAAGAAAQITARF